jgi:hypothetical protein
MTIQRSVLLSAVVFVLMLVLQREFDNASVIAANRQQAGDEPARQQAIGWMEAANQRMRTVGCYG